MINKFMEGKFAHFILTRFNIRWSKDADPPSDKWLKHRFNLFDKYCYPSVRNQTNQDFRWLVFFDSSTPKKYRGKIKKYSKWKNFIPCFVSSSSLDFKERINSSIDPDTKYIITTRLDNDDAVAKNFIEVIHRQFKGQNFEFINIIYGYVLYKRKLYKRSHKSNSFMSLIEERKDFKTVWCKQHGKVSSVGKVKQIESKPLWFQVFHDKNYQVRTVDNNMKRIRLIKLRDDFSFNLHNDFYHENLSCIFLENLYKSLMRILFKLDSLIRKLFHYLIR